MYVYDCFCIIFYTKQEPFYNQRKKRLFNFLLVTAPPKWSNDGS